MSQGRWNILLVLFKLTVLVYIVYYVYTHFLTNHTFLNSISIQLCKKWNNIQYTSLLLVLILLPINWLIEAYKWYLLQQKSAGLSFYQCWKNVIKGITYAILLPPQIGDLLGKLSTSKPNTKLNTGFLSLFGGIIQSYIALCAGVIGFLYLYVGNLSWIYQCIAFVLMGFLGLMIFYVNEIARFVNLLVKPKSNFLLEIDVHKLLIFKIIVLSKLRYMVFVLQFLFVLQFFEVKETYFKLISAIMLTYLGKTFIPALNIFGELGTREFAALVSFEHTHVDSSIVFISSMMLWIINIFIPVILGIFYLFEHHLFKPKH